MENNTIEMALLEPEEREMVEFIFSAIPAADRDEATGEMEYLDGEVDETEQLNYVLRAAKEDSRAISGVQIQLIQDAELQYGIEHGYYEEE